MSQGDADWGKGKRRVERWPTKGAGRKVDAVSLPDKRNWGTESRARTHEKREKDGELGGGQWGGITKKGSEQETKNQVFWLFLLTAIISPSLRVLSRRHLCVWLTLCRQAQQDTSLHSLPLALAYSVVARAISYYDQAAMMWRGDRHRW